RPKPRPRPPPGPARPPGFEKPPFGPDTNAAGTRSNVYSRPAYLLAASTRPYLSPTNKGIFRSLEPPSAAGRPNDPATHKLNSFLFLPRLCSARPFPPELLLDSIEDRAPVV